MGNLLVWFTNGAVRGSELRAAIDVNDVASDPAGLRRDDERDRVAAAICSAC